MTKQDLAKLHKLHIKGSWTYDELNELTGLYKDYYVWVETNKIMPISALPSEIR